MVDYTERQCAIGIDVGGTKCAAGLIALDDGRVLARRLQPTRPERGGAPVLADVIAFVQSLQEEAKRLSVLVGSIGIGLCELVGPAGKVLSEATVCWKEIPVIDWIREGSQLLVFLDADVRAAARGEAHFGAGRGLSSFLYVTVGTGISASLVVNQSPYAGARGLTGTFASSDGLIAGHDGDLVAGPPLEQFAAGPAIAARFATERIGFDGAAPDVLTLAGAGDAVARSIVTSAGQALGAAIAQLVNVLDPEAVVIGGGLGLAEGLYRDSLELAMRKHVYSELHHDVRLLSAQLGNDAGMIGAAIGAAFVEGTKGHA